LPALLVLDREDQVLDNRADFQGRISGLAAVGRLKINVADVFISGRFGFPLENLVSVMSLTVHWARSIPAASVKATNAAARIVGLS